MNFLYLIVWFKRIVWLLLIYTGLRVLFLLFNLPSFQSLSTAQVAESFLLGIRFDLSAIFIGNSLFTLCALLPFGFSNSPRYQSFLRYIYWIPNIVFFWVNIADFEYYKFIGRRTIFDVFGIMGDIGQQAFNLIGAYWYLLLIWGLISWVFVRGTPSAIRSPRLHAYAAQDTLLKKPAIRVLVWILSLGVSVLVFRGGFQEKPLRINQAFSQNNNHLGNLTLNTTFTFLTTIDAKGTDKVHFFDESTPQLAAGIARLRNHNIDTELLANRQPQNVVVIILESFAREYMGYKNSYKGYTPFLDSLAGSGVFYENCFANGRESIIAMPAITAAIPQLMDEPYITASYQSNNFNGLGSILRKSGYSTSFFHAARNGSMGFEGFSQLAGFDRYYGLNQYPDSLKARDFDKNWGIFDEPYLQYFAGELSKEQKPFVSCVFTLSSHHPYTIPPQHKWRFPKGTATVHESVGYADFALQQFFKTASQQPWFANTLFIITADHTQVNTEPEYATPLGAWRVPLLVYHPDADVMAGIKQIANPLKVCHHSDVLPTVLDFLNADQRQVLPFGESVFAPSPGLALQYSSQVPRMVAKPDGEKLVYFELMPDNGVKAFDGSSGRAVKVKDHSRYERQLKAFVQYYRNGLIENSWVDY